MSEGLLCGVRVIDLTQNVAGPFCTQILGDLGAEVIKIERPASGDDARDWRPPEVFANSATFLALNRNKRSVGVDIDSAEGQRIIRHLARDAHVFVHSLKPGSVERRGLSHADLMKANPALIYSAISAFGQTGPLASLPGYDPLLQAFTGIMSVTGTDGQEPVRVGVSLIDMGTGLWSALGILAALLRKKDDGRGAVVETSLLETGVSWMTVFAANYYASGVVPKRMGSALAMTAPYELFRTSDGHVFIAAGNNRLFRAVCTGLGCASLAEEERFATNPSRVHHRAALRHAIEQQTSKRTSAETIAALHAVGAPCSELNDVAAMLSNDQVDASGIMVPLRVGDGELKVVGLPLRIDGFRGISPRVPPALGAHTEQVLRELGYSVPQVESLRDLGVIG